MSDSSDKLLVTLMGLTVMGRDIVQQTRHWAMEEFQQIRQLAKLYCEGGLSEGLISEEEVGRDDTSSSSEEDSEG